MSGGIIARCAACVDLAALWDGEVDDNGRALAEVVTGLYRSLVICNA